MTNDSTPFLIGPWKQTWYILKGEDWNVKCITESNEAGSFVACIDVKATRQHFGLVGYNAYRMSSKVAKPTNNVHCIIGLNFQKATIVENFSNDVRHIVWFVGILGNHVVQGITDSIGAVGGFANRSSVHVVRGEHIAKVTCKLDCSVIAVGCKVGDA